VATGDLPADRLDRWARRWRVAVDEAFETATSLIAYGRRDERRVVLKIVKREDDEWRAGEVLRAFSGRGAAVVLECSPGALLTERLTPGTSLVTVVQAGRDDDATKIIAQVIDSMSLLASPSNCPALQNWGKGFDWYAASGDSQIPKQLVDRAKGIFTELEGSQTNTRVLHGDLQHSNVLFDDEAGWVAIDPKGVVGEREYEIGAALRNPREVPDLIGDPAVIERRIDQYVAVLSLDRARTVGWAFAQAVLSMIWTVEDDGVVAENDPSQRLALSLQPMLQRWGL
jgi:streptomycin 6-kinase